MNDDVQSTQFNAGVAIAIELQDYFRNASYSRINENLPLVYSFLKAAEITMASKFKNDKKAQGEIDTLHSNNSRSWKIYMKKYNLGKKSPGELYSNVQQYLSDYQRTLLFYRDKWGYGMPSKDDPRLSL